jgi:hypothetical protein
MYFEPDWLTLHFFTIIDMNHFLFTSQISKIPFMMILICFDLLGLVFSQVYLSLLGVVLLVLCIFLLLVGGIHIGSIWFSNFLSIFMWLLFLKHFSQCLLWFYLLFWFINLLRFMIFGAGNTFLIGSLFFYNKMF